MPVSSLTAGVGSSGFSRNPTQFRLKPGRRTIGLACLFFASLLGAAEVLPPPPQNHFNDYARLVRPATATQLNRELAEFERTTSNQIVVAIYPRLESKSSVEDYAVRVAQSWRVGQKDRKNGAVLFFFQESHDIRIVTGYGLEGVLPDALCKRIIENEISPRFRTGDFDGGVTGGVHALLAAARGEYRGTGRTAREGTGGANQDGVGGLLMFVIVAIIVIGALKSSSNRGRVVYGRDGCRTIWGGGGGGSFSGGGGSFGGGGAGGKW
ncbi:MAG: TPM domain-containing protein [Opitutus sp.]|nr:TPM domain-containing protein [Opitutus sp.]